MRFNSEREMDFKGEVMFERAFADAAGQTESSLRRAEDMSELTLKDSLGLNLEMVGNMPGLPADDKETCLEQRLKNSSDKNKGLFEAKSEHKSADCSSGFGARFNFVRFSEKQKILLGWWMENSPFAHYDGVVADGAVRSGKTVAMVLGFFLWSSYLFSHKNFIISGSSVQSVYRNVLGPLLQMLDSLGFEYELSRSRNVLTVLETGNNYYVFGGCHEDSQDSLQGLTAAGWLGDEAALHKESFIKQAMARCSVAGSRIWLNCNPESPRHFVYKELISKAEDKNILYISFQMEDNLSLSKDIIERYHKLFEGVWYDRFVLGKWVDGEGLVYSMFKEDRHVVSEPDILPDNFKKIWVSCDYGTVNPCCFLLFGLDKEDRILVMDEFYFSSRKTGFVKTDRELVVDLSDFIKDKNVELVIVDPSAASFIWECRKAGISVKKAHNSVSEGMARVASLLAEDKIFISSECKNLLEEMKLYSFEKDSEKPVKENDHACDALRYGVMHIKSGSEVFTMSKV